MKQEEKEIYFEGKGYFLEESEYSVVSNTALVITSEFLCAKCLKIRKESVLKLHLWRKNIIFIYIELYWVWFEWLGVLAAEIMRVEAKFLQTIFGVPDGKVELYVT